MDIQKLKKEEIELKKQLFENLEKQKAYNKTEFIQKYGVNIGDTVEWREGSFLRMGVISDIEFKSTLPYFQAFLINGSGKKTKRKLRIWNTDSIKVIH